MSSQAAARAPVRPQGQEEQQQQQPEAFWAGLKRQIPIMVLVFVMSQWIGRKVNGPPARPGQTPAVDALPGSVTTPVAVAEADLFTVPIWPLGSLLDVHVALGADASALNVGPLPKRSFLGVRFGDWDWEEQWDVTFPVPQSVQRNGSLWLDMVVAPAGAPLDPQSKGFDPLHIYHRRKLLSRWRAQRRIRKVKNLLAKDVDEAVVEEEPDEFEGKPMPIVSYYHPNVTVGLVTDSTVIAMNKMPPVLSQHIQLVPTEATDPATGHNYRYPVAFFNDFWILKEHLQPINETVTELPMRLTIYPLAAWKFQLLASMTEAFDKQAAAAGGSGGELDEIKRMLTETAPWLLITTIVVSVLHSVFEFLAFSSDVKHWRGKKELVGVSVRTILTNCFVQLVILLYLLDNSDGTSWMILFGQGIGLLIEAWKITKAVDIRLVRVPGRTLPKLSVSDKHVLSEDERKTQEYDKLAFRYVAWVTAPCLAAYTVYSLLYQTHRGWYSFVIGTLTSFVYMGGFVQLVPQLIINYKLKSVAHLPMKAMFYKTLNTFVDDLFAFCIKMPTLHRLACFRDDVVFFVLLYQYWIYRVDYGRVNEYGQGGADEPAKPDETGESKKDR